MSLDEALGIWGEAAQDMVSAGLALAAANFYNVADLSNQVAEKALQSVYVLRHDARATYDHDLRALGELLQAPAAILDDLDALTPYHPSTFLVGGKDPELADDEVGPEAADAAAQRARRVLRWARQFVLGAG